VDRLLDRRRDAHERVALLTREAAKLDAYLAIAPDVTVALESLSQQLFQQILGVVQEKLTIALQEVIDQPIVLKAVAGTKRKASTVEFCVERDGCEEDILRGQGGSVANVLSVGLRMFALATLDPAHHRRFLVLDEQDCWLRPDLVPKLVKIVHDAAHALGFQVIMISHHDVAIFEQHADRILRLEPSPAGGVEVRVVSPPPTVRDGDAHTQPSA
jgi:ABC-type glutathione transport system ATPase component